MQRVKSMTSARPLRVMAGLVPAIHVFDAAKTWIPGTRPGMTNFGGIGFIGCVMSQPLRIRIFIGCVAALSSVSAHAQDVPGIEICTVDKTMERRTSCLQSNVEFLVKTINRLRSDHEQKLDAANRQIAALKVSLEGMQKSLAEMQAAKAVDSSPAKGAPAAVKDAPPVAKDAK